MFQLVVIPSGHIYSPDTPSQVNLYLQAAVSGYCIDCAKIVEAFMNVDLLPFFVVKCIPLFKVLQLFSRQSVTPFSHQSTL